MELDHSTNYKDLQEMVMGPLQLAHVFENGDHLYVNENGLHDLPEALEGKMEIERAYLFDLGAHQAFAGKGVIVGAEDQSGLHQDARCSVEVLRGITTFLAPVELIQPPKGELH